MRTQTRLISDFQDLYRLLATPGIEVSTLVFAGEAVCWLSWRHSDLAHVPMLRHTKDELASYLTAGEKCISTLISTLCRNARSTQTLTALCIFNQEMAGTGECWRVPGRCDVRAKAVRIYIRVRVWRAQELCVPNAQYRDRCRGNRV